MSEDYDHGETEAKTAGAKKGPAGYIHRKTAEKYRGFLVYVSRTYNAMVPFLKGPHLTLDSWRPDRDEDGWRSTNTLEPKVAYDYKQKPPQFVKMVSRFKTDMEMLLKLTRHEQSPKLPVRPTSHSAAYLVGDASGSGYGSTLWEQGANKFDATYGGWTSDLSNASSNVQEVYNLLLSVEAGIQSQKISKGKELFVFTDNMVSERCFYSGRSKSKALHALIVKMHDLIMRGELFVHFAWISGERMKIQGTDALSRGDENTGVMAGDSFLKHIPLNENAFERQPKLLEWLSETLPGNDWEVLDEKGWFETTACKNPRGKFIWAPPPCCADICMEQLCEVFHIHPESSHVFVCPAIMTIRWRKQLRKQNDALLTIKEGSEIWPEKMLEPLILSLTSPLLNHRP